jgi:hypothetical protein
LPRRRAQRTECEDHEQRAQEDAADFRRDVQEHQHDDQADGRLLNDEVVILETVVQPGFGHHPERADRDQAADDIGGGGRKRGCPRIGVEQEDQPVDDVTEPDHAEHLPPLLRAARQKLRRQLASNFRADIARQRRRDGLHVCLSKLQAEPKGKTV